MIIHAKDMHDVLCNHVSLVDVALDLLAHTRALDSQTVLDTLGQLVLGALGGVRQQLLNAVLPRQLHQLRLSPLRIDRILPSPRHGMLVESKRVRPLFLEGRRRRAGSDERRGRPARKEALQRLREALCELDEVRRRGHGRYRVLYAGIGLGFEGERAERAESQAWFSPV